MAKQVSSELKILSKHSSIYSLSKILNRFVSFILLPLYLSYLTPAHYAILDLLYFTLAFISIILEVGVTTVIGRFYFDSEDEEIKNKIVSTAFYGFGFSSTVIILLISLFSEQFSNLIFDTIEHGHLFELAFIGLALDIYINVAFSFLRVRHQSLSILVISMVRLVGQLCLNILFIAYYEMGVKGILLSTVIVNTTLMLYIFPMMIKQIGFSFSWTRFKEMIRFGLPLIPSNFMAYIVNVSDRFFLNSYFGLTSTGLYTLGYRFGVLIHELVSAPFAQIWSPRRMEMYNKDDSERVFMKIFTYFTFLMLFVGLMISTCVKHLLQIIAEEAYLNAYQVVPLIVLAYIISSFHLHFNVSILYKKKTKYIMYINIISAAANLTLNYFLISAYGMWGAAYATLVSFTLKIILTYFAGNYLQKIYVEWQRVISMFVLAGILYWPIMLIETGHAYVDFFLKILLSFSFPIILYLIRFFTPSEIEKGKELVRNKLAKFIPGFRK